MDNMSDSRKSFGVKKNVLKDSSKRELLIKRIKEGGEYPIPPLYVVSDITKDQISFYLDSPISSFKQWEEVPEEEWKEKLKKCIEKYTDAEFFYTKEHLLETLEKFS